MYKMGVIDPLKVTKSALQNAVSVAVTILYNQCYYHNGQEHTKTDERAI